MGSLVRPPGLGARRLEVEEGRAGAKLSLCVEPAREVWGGLQPEGPPAQSTAGSRTQAPGGTVTPTASSGRARAGVGPVTRSTTSEPSSRTR